jgi:ACS family hexuronate transporter-like MFS transporter
MIDAPSITSEHRRTGFRYLVAAFCFVLGLVNYLDRVVISYAIKPIERDFAITDASFGLLMSAFAVGTLAVNGLSGGLLDRFGARRVWSIGLLVWSIAMILQGFVETFWIFLALRVLMGAGEGVNFPAMNRALVDWMKPGELGRAVSFSLLGVPLALLLGGAVLVPLIGWIGWRWAFVILGIAGLVLTAVFLALYRQPPGPTTRKTQDAASLPLRTLLRNRTLLATGWSFFGFGWVLFFGLSWLPGYLEQTWDMELGSVAWSSSLPWAIALGLMPLGGWLSDAIMAKTGRLRSARVHPIWICQLLAVLCFVPVPLVGSAEVAVLFVSLAIGFSMAPNSPYYSICAELFPPRTGTATGVIVTFFSAAGIVCPWITGWIADVAGGFGPAFATLCVVVGTGVLGMLIFARDEPAAPRA